MIRRLPALFRSWLKSILELLRAESASEQLQNSATRPMDQLDHGEQETPANALVVRRIDYRAHGPPNRALSFELSADNTLEHPIAVLGDWTQCKFQGRAVAEGRMVKTYHTGGYSVLEEGGCRLDVRVPLSRETLEHVENKREGEDLEYDLSVDLYVARVSTTGETNIGAPWKVVLAQSQHGHSLEGEFPQSDWLDLLKGLGWEETLLVEIPARRLRHRSPQAMNRYREALNHHRRGNWRKSLAACREVFEALAWRHTDDEATEPDMRTLRNYFPDNRKGETINSTLKELAEFLHLGRHVQNMEANIDIERKDSVLALNITAGVLRYTAE